MTNPTTTTARPHQWEAAGLGLAPFRYAGMEECWFGGQHGVPRKPGSTCDACGQSIAIVCWIKSADGQRFKVGCDCVRKLSNDRNRRAADPIVVAMDRDRRERQTAKRHKREAAKIAAGMQMIDMHRTWIEALPHPFPDRAKRGETLADYADFFVRCAGNSGTLKMIKRVEQSLAADAAMDDDDVQLRCEPEIYP